MKKSILSLALLCVISASAQKINPVTIGRNKVADSISVTVLPFKTTAKTCSLYYEVFDCDKKRIDEGNLSLTEAEWNLYGYLNVYIEDIALQRLEFVRKEN